MASCATKAATLWVPALCTGMTLAGCAGVREPQSVQPHIASSAYEVADVFVSAYPVIEWSDCARR